MTWKGKQEVRGLTGGQHGGMVQLGDSIVPPKAVMTFEGSNGSPDVTMNFEIRDGRPECVGITVQAKGKGRGIRSADLAMFNLDNLVTGVFAQLATFPAARDHAEWYRAEGDVHEARTTRRGGVTRAELERVAEVYREHVHASPTRTVALLLGYTERTAARRVQQAREADPPLLPPTTPGKRKA